MKHNIWFIIIILMALATNSFSQNIGINENGASPNASAILHVQSTNKGMLVPRMTTAQRISIPAPATGLLVFDVNTNGFWFFNGTVWIPILSGSISGNTLDEAYDEGGAGVGRTIIANAGAVAVHGTDGFEVTGTFDDGAVIVPAGAGARMFYNPRKSAIRAGYVSGNQWDNVNVGNYSAAFGNSNTASGVSSFAAGSGNTVSGAQAAVFGNNSTASGTASTAFGFYSNADAYSSVAIGRYNVGGGNSASWVATDPLFEIGIGIAPANRSNAFTVLKDGKVGIGTVTPTAVLHHVGTLRIVEGNQASGRVLTSDANGNATWQAPAAQGVTLDGAYDFGGAGAGRQIIADAGAVRISGTDGIIVTGTINSGATVEVTGSGTRMFFNPHSAAFRAGTVSGAQWNAVNLGVGSFAVGQNTRANDYAVSMGNSSFASGTYSVAMGNGNIAEGFASVAMGETSFAEGSFSVAIGANAHAVGESALAFGEEATADGDLSVAFSQGTALGGNSMAHGQGVTAHSGYEVALGRFNTSYTPSSSGGFNINDRAFVVGNGTSNVLRSNAFTVMKNGNVGIGTDNPQATLNVVGGIRYQDGQEANGRVLVTNDDGDASWQIGHGFSAQITADVNLTSGSTIVFGTEQYDRGNNYDAATGVFTAPFTGLYHFDYIEHSTASAGNNTGIDVYKNGLLRRQYATVQAVTAVRYATTISWNMFLDAGDTVYLQTIGVTRTYSGSTVINQRRCMWEGTWIK